MTDENTTPQEEAMPSLARVLYTGEIENAETGEHIYVKVLETADGYAIAIEDEEGNGAFADLLPDSEEAVSRAKDLVESLQSEFGNENLPPLEIE
jgi:hypothetical protein